MQRSVTPTPGWRRRAPRVASTTSSRTIRGSCRTILRCYLLVSKALLLVQWDVAVLVQEEAYVRNWHLVNRTDLGAHIARGVREEDVEEDSCVLPLDADIVRELRLVSHGPGQAQGERASVYPNPCSRLCACVPLDRACDARGVRSHRHDARWLSHGWLVRAAPPGRAEAGAGGESNDAPNMDPVCKPLG